MFEREFGVDSVGLVKSLDTPLELKLRAQQNTANGSYGSA